MFGVIAGLCGRVVTLDHDHGKQQSADCCDQDHGDQAADPDQDHGPDCPTCPHDHHTHTCCHPAPIAGDEIVVAGLVPPYASLIGVAWPAVLPPDGPVFALDKPPLI